MTVFNGIAARVSRMAPPAVGQVRLKAKQLEKEGWSLVYLMRGEPDFDTPAHICGAAVEALRTGQTHYSPTRGIPELRSAVASRMLRDFGEEVDPDGEVLITDGASMGLFLATQAVIDVGDEVILFNPVYDPYPSVVRMAGGVPVSVVAEEKNGHFTASVHAIERALTKRTRAILLNNPWNPTGTVLAEDEIRDLVSLAEAYDLVLIADEIYEKIVFDGRTQVQLASVSPQARRRTITVNSFSKTYAMTGWRLGYNIAPPALTEAMLRISQQCSRSATTFVQFAGVAALNGPQDAVDLMIQTYEHRRDLVTQILEGTAGLAVHPPEGTFFFLVDMRQFGMNSQDMAQYLLEHARVVTVPGGVYGSAAEGYIRLSFAYSEDSLRRGCSAIVRALEHL